jgi:transposase
MGKRPRSYPPEFRQTILALVESGRKIEDLGREFEVSTQTIRNWVKQYELDAGKRHDGLTSEERAELLQLRRDKKRLTIENEILSKAAAWFARETNSIPDKRSSS